MGRTLAFFAAAALSLSSGAFASIPRTWELNDGRFNQLPDTQPAREVATDPGLRRIEERLDRGEFSAARKQTLAWLAANHASPDFPLGLYLMAQAAYGDGEPVRAFYYCDELMDDFPTSSLFAAALQLQYDMADGLLNGSKLKFLGVRFLDGTTEGVEMLFRIQARSPGSPLAEKSLHRTADYYFADGQYDLAADAYAALSRSYPRSPDAGDVKLRQAFSNYAQFTGTRFDPTPLINARTQLTNLIAEYPEIAGRENLPGLIDAIDRTLARKLAVTADYYRRTGKPSAAVRLLRSLRSQYPNTEEAAQAATMLQELKAEPDEPVAPGSPTDPLPKSVPAAPPAVAN